MEKTILLVTWDGGGNIPPELALCRALIEAGHEVHILSHDSLKERIEATGARFRQILHAGQVDSRDTEERPAALIQHALVSSALLSDIDDTLQEIQPGVAIVDSMMFTAQAALARGPIPSVGFHHTLASFLFGGFLDQISMAMKDKIDSILETRGITPYARPIDAFADHDVLLTATYEQFDELTENTPTNLFHIGPLRGRPTTAGSIDRLLPDRPLVLVGLSSTHMGQSELLQRIADALGEMDVEGLVTTGPAVAPETLSLPPNVAAREFVAHEDVLPHSELLITHAGHGTVMAGSTFGVPMLCIPMGRDQPAVAERARSLGIAHVCEPNASTEEIVAAVAGAFDDSSMTEASRAFSRTVANHPGPEEAVQRIAGLMN